MSVTYEAVLDASEDSVLFLSGLLHAERVRRGTRTDTRALGTYNQAVLALRWLFDDTRLSQLARDNNIGLSTAYEAIAVLAARQPSLATGSSAPGRSPRTWSRTTRDRDIYKQRARRCRA